MLPTTRPVKTFFELELERIASLQTLPPSQYLYLRQSKAFMESHYAEKIELAEIAAAAAMSRFHFLRLFRQVYGLTPRQLLRDLRIANAKKLLKTGKSVTEVCQAVGYDSLPSFSSCFKRGVGQSPKAYQQSYLRNRG